MSELPETPIFNRERLQASLVVQTMSISSHIQEQRMIEGLKTGRKFYRHKATKGIYELLALCYMQVNSELDMAPAVIYQNVFDHLIWCRPRKEFNAKFEMISEDEAMK